MRWKAHKQGLEFRHRSALEMAEEGAALDLGCGDGAFLDVLRERGIDAEGADISSEAVARCAQKDHRVKLIDIAHERLPFDDKMFDSVFVLDVLEHLYNPGNFLKEAARISRSRLIIGVPNFNSLPARIQVLLGRVPENNKPSQGHVYWFNERELRKMLEDADLKLVELRTNTFWEDVPVIKYIMKLLKNLLPGIFALSFVVKVKI